MPNTKHQIKNTNFMADDQGPKIASIDELVNELTKKNSSTPPSGGPAPSTPPKPPMGSQFQPNPMPAPTPAPKTVAPQPEIPKPKFTPPPPPSAMPRPAPSPAPTAPSAKPPMSSVQAPSAPPTGGPKEYQSSIRTMKDDIATLKQGQKPAGVDVPRIMQPSPLPSAPVAPKPPVPGQPQQFKMPSVDLGQAEKTGPLPQTKPERPFPSPVPTPSPEKTQVYVPPSAGQGISGGGNNRLFMVIGGAALFLGFLYWFLVLRAPAPEIVSTPTPTPTPVATPVATLSELFNAQEYTMSIDASNSEDSFSASLSTVAVEGGKFRQIRLKDMQGGNVPWTSLASVSQQVLNSLGGEVAVFAYGQKEMFGQNGQLNPAAPVGTRAVIVAEVRDASSAIQWITAWEPTMTEAFRKPFSLNPAQQPDPNFMNSSYQGASIRFRNFPFPDRSIDVGVISSINRKIYLVIAGSRESMFSSIEALRGISKSMMPISSPTPIPTPSPTPLP